MTPTTPDITSDPAVDIDVAIVGGGPLGMAAALALAHNGQRVRVFDARPPEDIRRDARVLALSHGSRQLLERLDAWPASGVTHIGRIHVSQRGALGRTLIRAEDYGVPALGYVLPATALIDALAAAVARHAIDIQYGTRVTAIEQAGDAVRIALSHNDGTTQSCRARLAACCEGAVGEDGGRIVQRDYDQHALLCRVTPAAPHGHLAFERFTPHGPIALLPLGGDYAVVWTVSPARLQILKSLDNDTLLGTLHEALGGSRVTLTNLRERASYPLGLRFRRTPAAARCVWLGNAAQTLHPVAGQGFNLALRDVIELADTVGSAADAGAPTVLSRYLARRRLDRIGAIGFTDSLVRVFSTDNPLLTHLRGAGLLAMDVVPPLRHFVAKRMMFGARAWP